MANFQRRLIIGRWREGYALDIHTLTSIFVGHDEFGHPRFESNAPKSASCSIAFDERMRMLAGLYKVDASATAGKRVLLFDDLYRSGATMNEITTALYGQGRTTDVFALTITRTRSIR